ncbi:MAG: hypothetical protein RIF32_10650, partial [Leptospirales bacterium]
RAGSRPAGVLPAFLILAAIGVAGSACGGLDPQTSLQQLPGWRPSEYFTGPKIGYQTVFDRNGNVREVARIERTCVSTPADQAGVCEDQIDYGYTTPDTAHTTRWSIHYITDLKSRVAYQDGFGALVGETIGAMMVLTGERRLPGSPPIPAEGAPENDETKAASVEIRMHLRPGTARPMLQTELYTFWGIDIGRSETLWLDR